MTKREIAIYKSHGIEVKDGKLMSPIGPINPVLKKGNAKVGKNVWTFSTLPTNKIFFKTEFGMIKGTCPCTCEGGYCQSGHYHRKSVQRSMAINTLLAYKWLNWLFAAICAQLEIIGPCFVRIHATGEFFSDEYAEMWETIVMYYKEWTFWTYTKVPKYEELFDIYPNANIVKSIIPGVGFNYGHIDYILRAKEELEAHGEKVHICKCGVDDTQHCDNCAGCSLNKWVLFIEHSTEYVAKEDPLFPAITEVIKRQA